MKIDGHLMAYFTGKLTATVGIIDDLGTQRNLTEEQLTLLQLSATSVARWAANIASEAKAYSERE